MEHSGQSKPGKSCCAPTREPAATATAEVANPEVLARTTRGSTEGMRLIPGGTFLMGTDATYGFAADGEGPAHRVDLAPFHIDATCVTNEQFNAFVNATTDRSDNRDNILLSFCNSLVLDGLNATNAPRKERRIRARSVSRIPPPP